MDTNQIIYTSPSDNLDGVLYDGYKEEASIILQRAELKHIAKTCDCDFQGDGNRMFCIFAGWKNGVIPSKQIVEDYHLDNRNKPEE